jgi:enoyl-CoA hydratase
MTTLEDTEVLLEARGSAGLITLNRPKALNALNLSMVRAIDARLRAWADDPRIGCVVIRGAGEKAFCAGGDIRQLRAWGLAGDTQAEAFYREEYQLNALIKHYPKPYVALIDGIVMGGGVGVSLHGSHRFVGERTLFAMPETGIGFFPDVGATFALPRLPGSLGTYLALTGARLGPADLHWCGVATHSVAGASFDHIIDDLAAGAGIDETGVRHARPAGEPTLPGLMPAIDRCFGAGSVKDVLARLAREKDASATWATETAAGLRSKSPLSLGIAFRQMQIGGHADFNECMRIEYRIASRILGRGDFFEGVRALLVDKDNKPRWRHPSAEAVDDTEIDGYFAPLGEAELTFPNA